MILKCSKPGKKVVLSGNMSKLGDVLFLTRRMVEAEFAGQQCF